MPLCQHTMNGVTKLMQQRFHLVEGEEGGLGLCRSGKVHHDDNVWAAVFALLIDILRFDVVHPCARLLAVAREEVRVKHGQEATVCVIDLIGSYLGMIDRDLFVFLEGDTIQLGGQTKHRLLHMLQLKIGTGHLVVDLETDVA